MLSTYQQDAQFVDVYLDTKRRAVIDGTHYVLCAGWLGCVPYHEGMTFGQLEKEVLPHHFPVSCVMKKLDCVCTCAKVSLIIIICDCSGQS